MGKNWCRVFLPLLPIVVGFGSDWNSYVAEDLSKTPLPDGLVARQTAAAPAAVVCFLEGPAVDAAGNVFFSDIAGSRILKMDAKGAVTTFRADSGRTNGVKDKVAGAKLGEIIIHITGS